MSAGSSAHRGRGMTASRGPASALAWSLVPLLVLGACATGAGSPTAHVSPELASPAASAVGGQLVDIGGRSLYLECRGSGTPTVILESGLGGDHRTWESVQPELADSVQICAYDRANISPSDPAPGPRTAADSVDDLKALLDAAGIERPIILVGFSMGGIISQLYAATYPEEVAGLVLVESNHPDEWNQFRQHLTPQQIEADRQFSLDNRERLDPYASLEETHAAGPLPEMPLVVVTAPNARGQWPPDWDRELFDRLRAEQQADLASRTPGGGVQVFAEVSGHHVPSEQPQVIIDAVETVLESAGS
jgi:pimeloyl-ACP methyl ester carboxylesterase